MIACDCIEDPIPWMPTLLADSCSLVLPLKSKESVFKGLGLNAFYMTSAYEVSLHLRNDGYMKAWRSFYKLIKRGGDMFYMPLNRHGTTEDVPVRLSVMNPKFRRSGDGWFATLKIQEVNPPGGVGSDAEGNVTFEVLGSCSWYGFRTLLDEDEAVTCPTSLSLDGEAPSDCNQPQPSIMDIFGDGSRYAYYRFDDSVADEGGNYDASAANIEYAPGYIGKSVKFFDTGAGIDVVGIPLDYDALTLSFWFSPSGSGDGEVYRSESGGTPRIVVNYDAISDAIQVTGSSMTAAAYSGLDSLPTEQPGMYPAKSWSFVVVVFKEDHQVVIYIDGEDTTDSQGYEGTVTPATVDDAFILGEGTFKGRVDHLSLFNRELTTNSIAVLTEEVT